MLMMLVEEIGASVNRAEIENKPLWKFVEKLEKLEGGGNTSFKCNYCSRTFKGSYSRVKAHLLKITGYGIKVCPKVTAANISHMQKSILEAEMQIKRSIPKDVPLPTNQALSSSSSCFMHTSFSNPFVQEGFDASKKRKVGQISALEKAFNMQTREQLDNEIARMFFSGGVPFSLARNPFFKSSYAFAANSNIPGYVPPTYNALRTKLLQREKATVEMLLTPIKAQWGAKGVTIVTDGWTDPQRRPVINFMAVNENGPMFLRAFNCEGEYKDKYFISQLIKEVIEEVGPIYVVQIITDNAPVCRAAGLLIEQVYPHIFWTPCVVHTLNLALKNICAAKNTDANGIVYDECHWISIVAGDAIMVKNFIMNHSMRLAMFNDFSKLKLLSIAETRFASTIVMLKRFKLVKQALQAMVISDKWSCYREDDMRKARLVKDKLLDDQWWDKVDYILDFTEPIYDMLRVADTDRPSLHFVYDMWGSMISKVTAVIYKHEAKRECETSSFWNVVSTILHDRWGKSNTPLHCLAHSLNPRYSSQQWLSENSSHITPASDIEISNMRKACLKRLFQNDEERKIATFEFAKFLGCLDEFSDSDSVYERGTMEAKYWWVSNGATTPLIQALALKLFGQPTSSSCCERNWSTYSFVHSLRRNKITPERAKDLVFVHTNLRLLSRRTPEYKQGESTMWDVLGDTFDLMDDLGLEFANLSLDEPDLENALIGDEHDCGTGEEHYGVIVGDI